MCCVLYVKVVVGLYGIWSFLFHSVSQMDPHVLILEENLELFRPCCSSCLVFSSSHVSGLWVSHS